MSNDAEYLAKRVHSLHEQLDQVLLINNGLLRACKMSLQAAHDNYDGTEGWVGFGKTLGPLLEAEITGAENAI